MKTLNKLFLLIFASLTMTSCLVDDDVATDAYGDAPSLVGFTNATASAGVVADGEVKTYNAIVELTGPQLREIEGDVTFSVSVDDASTAQAGVHYEAFGGQTFTLTKAQSYIGAVPVNIITAGIDPTTVTEAPVLVLNIDNVSGSDSDALANGRTGQIKITINYLCPVDLSGTFLVSNSVCPANTFTVAITDNGDGSWALPQGDGGLMQYCTSNDIDNPGNIIVICGEVQPTDDVVYCTALDADGNAYGIGCITGGTWDEVAGILTIEHTDAFFGVGPYTSTWIRQ